jgi:hypothetical protein
MSFEEKFQQLTGNAPYASNHADSQVQYLPLPTLGKHTDGRIRRAIIVDTLGSLPLHRVSELTMKSLDGQTFTAVRETVSDGVFERYLKPSRYWVPVHHRVELKG